MSIIPNYTISKVIREQRFLHKKLNRKKKMERQFLIAKEIAEIYRISESKAYPTILQLNSELDKFGYLIFRGKVSKTYFYEKMYGLDRKHKGGE